MRGCAMSTTYIGSDSEAGKRYELRVGSVEGQLYSFGSAVTELRKQVESLQAEVAVLRSRIAELEGKHDQAE